MLTWVAVLAVTVGLAALTWVARRERRRRDVAAFLSESIETRQLRRQEARRMVAMQVSASPVRRSVRRDAARTVARTVR